jgi:hypothetical protein
MFDAEQSALWLRMTPVRIQEGVWESGLNPQMHVNTDHLDHFVMSMGNLHHPYTDKRDALTVWREKGNLSSYGVCDGVENLLTHADYSAILQGPRQFVIFLTEIRREDQGEGGWRWHKWGPYIGAYEPQYEYLADESIDRVFVFNIMEHMGLVTS